MLRTQLLVGLLVSSVVLGACGPSESVVETAIAQTSVAAVTPTDVASDTPAPTTTSTITRTSPPTATKTITRTPTITATPRPTNTPRPTSTPDPRFASFDNLCAALRGMSQIEQKAFLQQEAADKVVGPWIGRVGDFIDDTYIKFLVAPPDYSNDWYSVSVILPKRTYLINSLYEFYGKISDLEYTMGACFVILVADKENEYRRIEP